MRGWVLIGVGFWGLTIAGGCGSGGGEGQGGNGAGQSSSSTGGSSGGEFWATCTKNSDCDSFLCLEDGHCTKTCADAAGCPAFVNWSCAAVEGAGSLCQCTGTGEPQCGDDNDCDGEADPCPPGPNDECQMKPGAECPACCRALYGVSNPPPDWYLEVFNKNRECICGLEKCAAACEGDMYCQGGNLGGACSDCALPEFGAGGACALVGLEVCAIPECTNYVQCRAGCKP